MSGPPCVLVLCLGNPDRGDDGVGAAVAALLEEHLPPGVTLMARSGDMLALIEDWAQFDAIVCVDAAAPMGEPGRIHRIDLAHEELPRDMAFLSSHAFGLGEAVALARTLDLAPRDIVVYAIEGACFDGGAPLSAQVAAAAAPAAERVRAEAARLQEQENHA
ncbi:hydrogenase maturation protease [Novosphingobium mangrovi (ex Huang et al. 2023)]|uniref:Hydrogenase maturation protease n=1 Tax=Novosphingobium mangrovi (ex Huang et al. 2023) TaxID=2976432 RepID=A0ABT2I101_9SPHN|nr:hydrogenase maturation protease [Novosphingobium mangrovi (ex Huang et al. 2023)]MCT2398338.1 hydrogenase maturation protease [Novosphingobium mangrovi (ex Huang et al. 2023)]